MSDQPETLDAILAEMREGRVFAWEGCKFEGLADRIEAAVQRFVADDCAKCAHYNAATISLKDALDLANTIANHGINANDLSDNASATIYALCHEVRTVRGEDANIKQEVQKLRRELRDLRRAPGNAAALREALAECYDYFYDLLQSEYLTAQEAQQTGYPSMKQFSNENRLLDKARAALAAPARNCDRFDEYHDAVDAWHREERCLGYHEDGGTCAKDPLASTLAPVCFARWLFATAEGGAKCVNGLRGEPDCRGCNEHCEDVRKRNCFYWNPDIEGGVCALTGKKSCPISCDNFHVAKEEKPATAKGGKE